jgi:hypothetical protein
MRDRTNKAGPSRRGAAQNSTRMGFVIRWGSREHPTLCHPGESRDPGATGTEQEALDAGFRRHDGVAGMTVTSDTAPRPSRGGGAPSLRARAPVCRRP